MSEPKMPPVEASGFVPTLNKMGYMTSAPDEFSMEFVKLARDAKSPLLDIGAAYGVATIPALKAGATVFANDIDIRHLEVLKNRVSGLPESSSLHLRPGQFPEYLDLDSHYFEAILACRIMHFLDQNQIQIAFKKCYQWLKNKGTLIVVVETPYLKNFQDFIPVYEQRVLNNDPFPGFVNDPKKYAPKRAENLPQFIHFLDPKTLSRLAMENGFEVKECRTFARKDFPTDLQLDGRESVGLIAVKK